MSFFICQVPRVGQADFWDIERSPDQRSEASATWELTSKALKV